MIGLLVLAVYAAASLINTQIKINDAKNQNKQLALQAAELQKQQDKLLDETADGLDDETVERIAREKFGMVFPDDSVFVDISN